MSKRRVLYIPIRSHTDRVFRPEMFEQFRERFEVTINEGDENYSTEQVAEHIGGFDALVTGWGSPPLSAEVFERADRLKMVAHSAGSVKGLCPPEVVAQIILPRKICVFSGNHAIATNVAESTVGLLIMTSHHFAAHALAIRERGEWLDPAIPKNGQFLNGSTLGVVSASKVGREVIRLLEPFDLKLIVYDPYLSDEEAEQLNVEKVSLNELFARSDLVTVHAPMIPETEKMIGAEQLKRMKDGATLVNTSRGKVIDHDALLREARTGRILLALDVTDPEPLPKDSPFRKLPNVIITPHISGAGYYGYFKIGEMTVQALEDFFAGKPVQGAVPFERYEQLA